MITNIILYIDVYIIDVFNTIIYKQFNWNLNIICSTKSIIYYKKYIIQVKLNRLISLEYIFYLYNIMFM